MTDKIFIKPRLRPNLYERLVSTSIGTDEVLKDALDRAHLGKEKIDGVAIHHELAEDDTGKEASDKGKDASDKGSDDKEQSDADTFGNIRELIINGEINTVKDILRPIM